MEETPQKSGKISKNFLRIFLTLKRSGYIIISGLKTSKKARLGKEELMKKYLTIVLSLALVLPFVSCKFSSDYMFDGELATANVWAAADWNEEQVNAPNQAPAAQEAPKILDLSVIRIGEEGKVKVSLTLTNDAFKGFEVNAPIQGLAGNRAINLLFSRDDAIIDKKDGKCFVTIYPKDAIASGSVWVTVDCEGQPWKSVTLK